MLLCYFLVLNFSVIDTLSSKMMYFYSLYKNGAYTISLLDSIHLIPEDFVGYSPNYYQNNSGFSEPILTFNKTEAKSYVDQFPNMFIMPKVKPFKSRMLSEC